MPQPSDLNILLERGPLQHLHELELSRKHVTASRLVRLFRDHAVRPFYERNVDRRIAVLRVPVLEILFRDRPGPGARASREDGHAFRDELVAQFGQRRPSDRLTASAVALRIRYVASPVRKICTSCPASASASAWANTNAARVGSSVPHPPRIMILSFGFAGCACAEPTPNSDRPASRDRSRRRSMSAPSARLLSGLRNCQAIAQGVKPPAQGALATNTTNAPISLASSHAGCAEELAVCIRVPAVDGGVWCR